MVLEEVKSPTTDRAGQWPHRSVKTQYVNHKPV